MTMPSLPADEIHGGGEGSDAIDPGELFIAANATDYAPHDQPADAARNLIEHIRSMDVGQSTYVNHRDDTSLRVTTFEVIVTPGGYLDVRRVG